LLGEATVEDVLIAHELYHHLEATRAVTPIARRHQATLFQIGKWRWRTGIAALAEIAAGAFAQGLLGLPCHPKVLDFAASEGIGGRTANEFAVLTQDLFRTKNAELHSGQRASVEPEGEPSTEAAQASAGRSQPIGIAESLNDLDDLHDLVLRESRTNPDQGKQHLNAEAGHDNTIRAGGNGVDCAR
jgi:hypothetical protein